MKQLLIKRMRPSAIIPTRGSDQSAGADLYACIENPVAIPPGAIVKIPTGIAIALEDKNSVAYIFPRSGLGINHGISLANSVGVIDADYRGEIVIGLINHSPLEYVISPKDRIAQMVIMPIFMPELVETQTLPESDRGVKGLGSTGK